MWIFLLLIPLLVVVAFAVMSVTARRPDSLGVRDGRLAECPDLPNCVATQTARESQRMVTLTLTNSPAEAIERLKRIVLAMPRARIVSASVDYLHVEFASALFRFVDDVEFFVSPAEGVIHFRSASRVGHSDLGVNRQRMQAIVTAWQRAASRNDDSP